MGAYQILQNFNYNTVTWNVANAYTNMGISISMVDADILPASTSITASALGDAQFEITEVVDSRYENPSTNYGIAFNYYTGTIPYVTFKAKESGSGYYQAYMTVAYTYEYFIIPTTKVT